MGSALLSRFDLVFILLDKPDEVCLGSYYLSDQKARWVTVCFI